MGREIETNDSSANAEATKLTTGLEDYCSYTERNLAGSSNAQGASVHDGVESTLASVLSSWAEFVQSDAQAIIDADASISGTDATAAAGIGLIGGGE